MFYSEKLDVSAEAYLVNILAVWIACTAIWLARSFMVEFMSYYGHWLIKKHPTWESFFRSTLGEMLLKSKSSLGASHWANTEELLDRYTKSLRTSQKKIATASSAADEDSAPPVLPASAILAQTESNGPDPSVLLDLFFRDDALTVLAQWRETTDSAEDYAKLLSILTSVKGAGELIHMRMEMEKLERIDVQTADANAREENA
jgi:hypothetical protein